MYSLDEKKRKSVFCKLFSHGHKNDMVRDEGRI